MTESSIRREATEMKRARALAMEDALNNPGAGVVDVDRAPTRPVSWAQARREAFEAKRSHALATQYEQSNAADLIRARRLDVPARVAVAPVAAPAPSRQPAETQRHAA